MVYICRKINVPRQIPKSIEIRNFKNFDANQFQNDLEYAFEYYTYNSDPIVAWNEWKSIYLKITNNHAPCRLRRVKSEHSPWLNETFRN